VTQDLFRPEAVEHSTQRLHGDVVVVPKISHTLALAVLFAVIALAIAALLAGIHVETRTVRGEIRRTNEARSAAQVSAQLLVPPELTSAVQLGQTLQLQPTDVTVNLPIDARVIAIATQRHLAPPTSSSPALIYVPVELSVSATELEAAGLPLSGDYQLRVQARIVLQRVSWLRWFVEQLSVRVRKL
jgi:hypothetical protein